MHTQMIHETLHLNLNQPVTLTYFLLPRDTKAHSLVETASTIIPLDDLKPHHFCTR
jgi:hypothetical protein